MNNQDRAALARDAAALKADADRIVGDLTRAIDAALERRPAPDVTWVEMESNRGPSRIGAFAAECWRALKEIFGVRG